MDTGTNSDQTTALHPHRAVGLKGCVFRKSHGRGNQKGAHVVSFEYFHGPVPEGKLVCHSCDNRPCCNPEHLFAGTHQDNKDDEVAKGRHVFGERVGNHKVFEDDVLYIKQLLNEGYSQAAIARTFNVTKQAIWRIKEGLCWGWLK